MKNVGGVVPKFHVVSFYPDLYGIGGPQVILLKLAQGLRRFGVELTIVCSDTSGPLKEEFVRARVSVLEVPQYSFMSPRTLLQRYVQTVVTLRPDLLLTHDRFFGYQVPAILRGDIPSIQIMHVDVPIQDQEFAWIPYGHHHYSVFVGVSQQICNKLAQLVPEVDKVRFVQSGVELPSKDLVMRKAGGQGLIQLVTLGRLDQGHKRILDIPNIARILSHAKIPFVWHVVGTGPDESRLRSSVSDVGAGKQFIFYGAIAHSRVAEVLGRSDVIVVPSNFEGLPLALLEGMAYGCIPVISAAVATCHPLFSLENGLLVCETGDVQSFALAIQRVARESVSIRDQNRMKIYDLCARVFSVEQMVCEYSKLISELIKRSPCSSSLHPYNGTYEFPWWGTPAFPSAPFFLRRALRRYQGIGGRIYKKWFARGLRAEEMRQV